MIRLWPWQCTGSKKGSILLAGRSDSRKRGMPGWGFGGHPESRCWQRGAVTSRAEWPDLPQVACFAPATRKPLAGGGLRGPEKLFFRASAKHGIRGLSPPHGWSTSVLLGLLSAARCQRVDEGAQASSTRFFLDQRVFGLVGQEVLAALNPG